MASTERRVPFQTTQGDRIVCGICPHNCRLKLSQTGICRVRAHQGDDALVAVNYGVISSYAVDPVEKKPLYHFWPGHTVLSVGSFGCSFRCGFCQNYEISQSVREGVRLSPDQLIALAVSDRVGSDCVGIAFTYSEPLMWYEYVIDVAEEARRQGLQTVLVTNGFVNEQPRGQLLPVINALNVDVKAMDPGFYRRYCSGGLDAVLATVADAHAAGCHVEVTNLLVPGLNDQPEEVEKLARWLAGIDPGIPLHITRYYPNYKFTIEPTSEKTLNNAWQIASQYLHYVYVGNTLGTEPDTVCPGCNQILGRRRGFTVQWNGITVSDGSMYCEKCGRLCDIVGQINM